MSACQLRKVSEVGTVQYVCSVACETWTRVGPVAQAISAFFSHYVWPQSSFLLFCYHYALFVSLRATGSWTFSYREVAVGSSTCATTLACCAHEGGTGTDEPARQSMQL